MNLAAFSESHSAFVITAILLSLAVGLQHFENLRLTQLPRLRMGILAPRPYRIILIAGLVAACLLPLVLLSTGGVATTSLENLPSLVLISMMLFSLLAVAVSFGGSFNGGADYMSLQIALALWLAALMSVVSPPAQNLVEQIALLYIAVQLGLSYFISGLTKFRNPAWRSGRALVEIARGNNYDIPASLRARLLKGASPLALPLVLAEVFFPVALVNPRLTPTALGLAFLFHLGNFVLLGLNRFVFAWLAAYPAALYLAAVLS